VILNKQLKELEQWYENMGLSKELGPVAYGENEEEVFLGRSVQDTKYV
jgi:ATP-dependent Zn protease